MTHQYYQESEYEKESVEMAKLGCKLILPIVFFIALCLSFIWGVGLW